MTRRRRWACRRRRSSRYSTSRRGRSAARHEEIGFTTEAQRTQRRQMIERRPHGSACGLLSFAGEILRSRPAVFYRSAQMIGAARTLLENSDVLLAASVAVALIQSPVVNE